MRLPASFLGALLLCAPIQAGSQVVRGVIRDGASGAAIPGSVVSVTGGDGRRIASVLSGEDGAFAVSPPSAGHYGLRVERIGFQSVTLPTFAIGAGEVRRTDVTMRAVAVSLAEIRITGRQQCVVNPDAGAQTARLWQDVRTALTATALTAQQELVVARIKRFERVLAPNGRVQSEESRVHEGITDSPFRSVPVEDLERHGYMRERLDGSSDYFAPDAEVLLSDKFLGSHCFSVRAGQGATEGLLGLAFEPVPRVGRTDVQGVLWLERASAELRFLEFSYTGIPPTGRDANIGGRVEFARLPAGRWIVSRWLLRMPEFAIVEQAVVAVPGAPPPARRLTLASIRESGGEVLSTSAPGATPAASARLEGMVYDSVAMRPLAGARVFLSGTSHAARTDAEGRFAIDSVAEGRYAVSFSHARLDSLGAAGSVREVELPDVAGRSLTLVIPSPASIIATVCEGTTPESVLVLARVLRGSGESPAASGASVTASWSPGAGRATAVTDRDGIVRLCGLPDGTPVRIDAEHESYGRARSSVRLEAGEIRRVTLNLSY